jgi:hypothetical protein
MQDSGAPMQSVKLRQSKRLPPESRHKIDETGPNSTARNTSNDSSHIKISAAAHARLLLAKMASTSPAITTAGELLFERT